MPQRRTGHDLVVVGASAGGVEALMRLVAGLPKDYRGTVFVVLHVRPHASSALAEILDRAGPLPASQAENAQCFEPGHVYVAPPNWHLVLHSGHMALEAGPRENSARPAVDVLFRSAARVYGPRAVGVVLSGTLRDGALGLAAIKIRGGVSIVQDPAEAKFSGMPQSALDTTEVDYCLPVADIRSRLVALSHHTVEHVPMDPQIPESTDTTIHASDEPAAPPTPKHPNAVSGLTCPECHGSLWELVEGGSLRFECRTGHAYSLEALLTEQGESVEAALWAVNALQERAATFHRIAEHPVTPTPGSSFEERARQVEQQAEALLALLRGLTSQGQVG